MVKKLEHSKKKYMNQHSFIRAHRVLNTNIYIMSHTQNTLLIESMLENDDFYGFLQEKMFKDAPEYVRCKDTFQEDSERWIESLSDYELLSYIDVFIS